MKRALLFFDEIYFIFPSDKKYEELVRESKKVQVDDYSFSNFPLRRIPEFEILFQNHIFKEISPAFIVDEYGDYMVKAFEEDELDQELHTLGQDKREIPWNLFTEKIPISILRNRNFSQYLDGSRVSIPMIQRESIMTSHTISSCDYLENLKQQKICPISDEEFHGKNWHV